MNQYVKKLFAGLLGLLFITAVSGQTPVKPDPHTDKAKAIVAKAVKKVGGAAYLNARNSVGEGRLSVLEQGKIGSFLKFTDVIVFPDRERTDFEEGGSKTVQVNFGDKGWIYDESLELFRDQTEKQIAEFRLAMRTHYNELLRGKWNGKAALSYIGRRPSTLGKRNDVVKLEFEDGFWVEYEFDDDGLPMKTLFSTRGSDGQEIPEEIRYGRYISTGGILYPSVVDRYTNGVQIYRASYDSMEFNRRIKDEIFVKPKDPKKLRKKLKL